MKYHLCNLIVFVIFLQVRLNAAEPTNISVIDSLTAEIIRKAVTDLRFTEGDTIALQVDLEDPQAARYCRQMIVNTLGQKSLTIFRNYNRISSFDGMVIEISRFGATVLYSEPENAGLLGESYTIRTIQVNLGGQIFEAGSGKLVQLLESDRVFQDKLPYNMIEDMELSEYAFSRGKKQGYSGWEVYLEPFLVVSSVVAVVLLFFTQRN